jgi:hypothetical protein
MTPGTTMRLRTHVHDAVRRAIVGDRWRAAGTPRRSGDIHDPSFGFSSFSPGDGVMSALLRPYRLPFGHAPLRRRMALSLLLRRSFT